MLDSERRRCFNSKEGLKTTDSLGGIKRRFPVEGWMATLSERNFVSKFPTDGMATVSPFFRVREITAHKESERFAISSRFFPSRAATISVNFLLSICKSNKIYRHR